MGARLQFLNTSAVAIQLHAEGLVIQDVQDFS